MTFKLHDDAARSFDERATALLSELAPIRRQDLPPRRPANWLQPHVAAVITPADVVRTPTTWWRIGSLRTAGEIRITANQVMYAIRDEVLVRVQKLADQMQSAGDLKDIAGYKLVEKLLIEWLRLSLEGKAPPSMTEFVLSKVEEDVATYTFVFPIHELFIESAFSIGPVRLATVTRQDVENWYMQWSAEAPKSSFQVDIDRWSKRMQGRAAAFCEVKGARGHAAEKALDEVEAALAMLRLFSPAAVEPTRRSYCTVLGKERRESLYYLTLCEEVFLGSSSGIVGEQGTNWALESTTIKAIDGSGLEKLGHLLAERRRNSFQAAALDSLLIYSRSTLESTAEAKLIYIFAAIEAQLIRNPTEPIQDNIAHRLAYLTRRTVPERRQVISTVKEAYALRSKFFHHGVGIRAMEIVGDFMEVVWAFMMMLPDITSTYPTKEVFLERLDDQRLAG